MFTTVTPGAQELSIASSAAMPPNDAPYPTRGRHRDQRHAGQAADDRRQRTLHAGDDDEAVGGGEPVADAEQPVQPGDPDVVDLRRPRRRARAR